jgi:hypothetical protein
MWSRRRWRGQTSVARMPVAKPQTVRQRVSLAALLVVGSAAKIISAKQTIAAATDPIPRAIRSADIELRCVEPSTGKSQG